MIDKLFDKPLWQMTGEELFTIVQAASQSGAPQPDVVIDTSMCSVSKVSPTFSDAARPQPSASRTRASSLRQSNSTAEK